MKAAIIGGSGKMGRWFAGFLLGEGHEVTIQARNEERLLEAERQLGVQAVTDLAKAVDGVDLVLISVPVDNFRDVAAGLQPLVRPEQIILDLSSVKAKPVELMQRYLGKSRILGTHPVFGPGAKGVKNQNFVLTPTNPREEELASKVKQYLQERGAHVSVMTPREHDEMIAVILGLAHFIAIVSADTLLNFNHLRQMAAIAGPTYKVLLTLAESVLSEDPQLYGSLQMNIPGLSGIEETFLRVSRTWADFVANGDKEGFVERMNLLKTKMKENNPDFGRSYEDMYKMLDSI